LDTGGVEDTAGLGRHDLEHEMASSLVERAGAFVEDLQLYL
jgi:hypothetical protein